MRSFSQMLDSWSSNGNESLIRNIRNVEDLEGLVPKLRSMAAKDGSIEVDGIKVTVDRAIEMIKEYVGRELHSNYEVMKSNGLYVAQ